MDCVALRIRHDIVGFGVRYNVDMIAASFVRKAEDILCIREVLGEAGEHIKIVAKIENQEGLQNFGNCLLVAAHPCVFVALGTPCLFPTSRA